MIDPIIHIEYTDENRYKITMNNDKELEQEPSKTIHGSTYGGVSWGGTYKPQQPCDVAISKQAVLDLISNYDLSMGQVVKAVHALPPVNSQETAEWIRIRDDLYDAYSCSKCGSKVVSYNICECKFCYNCGRRMIKVQESER